MQKYFEFPNKNHFKNLNLSNSQNIFRLTLFTIIAILITVLIIAILIKKKQSKKKNNVKITTFNEIDDSEKESAKSVVYTKRLPDIEIINYKSSNQSTTKQIYFNETKENKKVEEESTPQKESVNQTEFITCKYCGCDNKLQNTTCERCGANIKH